MRDVTLIYCIKGEDVLLGMKKRGFAKGKLNGYGGKVESNEQITDAVIRELFEESSIEANKEKLNKVAEIDFYFKDLPKEKDWNQKVHVFFLKDWEGEPIETEEMKPFWCHYKEFPYEKMWIDDKYWLPLVFEGKKLKASFVFSGEGDSIYSHEIIETSFDSD
ncbi:MAG: 8-oxo-dGTP diphosphatase [Candidatus Woesearchaeota archaeon]